MKKAVCYAIVLSTVISCQFITDRRITFAIPTYLDETQIIPVDSVGATVIVVEKPLSAVNASEVIEEVRYIPIETTPESLIGYYSNISIYNDRIYILDYTTAEAVFIFDMEGKFIRKIGTKGGGPEEFYLLDGMCLDTNMERLVLYDNRKRKMMYYTLAGDFIGSVPVPYRFSGKFEILPSGRMVTVTSKSDGNFHLGKYDDYRLIFMDTDSLGKMQQFSYVYDDNINLSISWSKLFLYEDEIVYHPQYLNSIYTVTDTLIRQRYEMDFHKFNSPFDNSKIAQFENMEEFDEYYYRTTNLEPYLAETRNHLYFSLDDRKKRCFYFYDKHTGKMVGFDKMNWDTDAILDFSYHPKIHNYEDYFVAEVPTSILMDFKKKSDQQQKKLSESMNCMIDSLQEDDNPVIALFKVKGL